jgi:hypothetical protein
MNENANLERAAELVWDAIKLIDKNNYRQIRRALEVALDMIDEAERACVEAE